MIIFLFNQKSDGMGIMWLVKMYLARLGQLGVSVACRIHSTELKNRILIQFPDMQAHKSGRHVYLAFQSFV